MNTLNVRLLRTTLVLAVIAVGCRGDNGSGADTALTRDLTLAAHSAAQPALQDSALPTLHDVAPARAPDVPQAPPRTRASSAPPAQRPTAPATPVSTAAPIPALTVVAPAPAPAGRPGIAAGTVLASTSNSQVCTRTTLVGDKLTATLSAPVDGRDGASLPAGTTVVLEVASIEKGATPAQTRIIFRVRGIAIGDSTLRATGEVVPEDSLHTRRVDPKGSDKRKVVGGAVAGAVLGQILGRDTKSTVIGAAAGAAAGSVAAAGSARYEGCLPARSRLRITLSESLVL